MIRLARLPRLRNAYLGRGILVWFGTRFFLAYLGSVLLTARATLGLFLVVALTVALDARRRWEDILLGNLGIPLWQASAWALPFPVLAESFIPPPADVAAVNGPGGSARGEGRASLEATAVGIVGLLTRGRGVPRPSPSAPRPRPGTPMLEVDEVRKSFRRRVVLETASIHLVAGRITALMGRNGSGKTTLLRVAVGRTGADRGRVSWRGVPVPRPRLHRLARAGLFFTSQESALAPRFTVRQHLDALVTTYGRREELDRVVEWMRLEEFLDRRSPRISGGERQRASLAMALLRDPVCLVADEPFGGVAPLDRPLIAEGLQRLRERGCALVVTGHDVADLLHIADEVVWLVEGTTHRLGSPEAASRHARFRHEYLGSHRRS